MKIYIDDIYLPVLPESYQVTTSQGNQAVNVVSIGDVNIAGKRGLKELSFSSFFPLTEGKHGYTTTGSHKSPFSLCNSLEKKKDKGSVVRVIITETNLNEEFLIDEFSYGQEDGSGDIYYTIKFSEYVRPKVAVRNGNKTALSQATRGTKKTVSESYTVKKGDTLKSIAKSQLGSSSKYTKLAKLNHIASPYKLTSGQVIQVK